MTRQFWSIEWTDPAEDSLQRIHWLDASRVCAAVFEYAETGRVRIERLQTDDATTARLIVGSYRVRMSLDMSAGVIWVWTVYRRR